MSWMSKRVSGGPSVSTRVEPIKNIDPSICSINTYVESPYFNPNLKGNWNSIGTTTSVYDALIFNVTFPSQGVGSYSRSFFDIGTGGPTPTSWINNIWMDPGGGSKRSFSMFLPIVVPNGTALSVRIQSAAEYQEAYVTLYGVVGSGIDSASSILTLGANTELTGGAQLVGSETPFEYGPYTDLTASFPANAKWLSFVVGPPVLSPPPRADATFLLDVAYGNPYQTLIDGRSITTSNTDITCPHIHSAMTVDIPAGDRVSARIASSTAEVGAKDMGMVMYVGVG